MRLRTEFINADNMSKIAMLIFIAVVLYFLSYVPAYYIAIRVERDICPSGSWRSFYRPVEWVSDNTFLHYPMHAWAKLWGIGGQFEFEYRHRNP